MKVAVIGSRGLGVANLGHYLPKETELLVSGGAQGVDASAEAYALQNNLCILEYLPDYGRYGRQAPLRRNRGIVQCADLVLAFWDGRSRGTQFVIDYCHKTGVPIQVYQNTEQGYVLIQR